MPIHLIYFVIIFNAILLHFSDKSNDIKRKKFIINTIGIIIGAIVFRYLIVL